MVFLTTPSVPFLYLTLSFRHTCLSVFKIFFFNLILTFSLLFWSSISLSSEHLERLPGYCHPVGWSLQLSKLLQGVSGVQSTLLDQAASNILVFMGANRWSLVGTHSLWASCPTKRLSVIVLNLCCFYAPLGSTAVVKKTQGYSTLA